MPGMGFITMAVKALYQKHRALLQLEDATDLAPNDLCYRFRNVRFSRALMLEEGKNLQITFTLMKVPGSKDWHEFRISTSEGDVVSEHCHDLARIQDPIDERLEGEKAASLKSPQAPKLWYKCQREWGNDFGPTFQRLIEFEAVSDQRFSRSLMSLSPPESKHSPQSYYPIHPAALDGCLQTASISNVMCDRTKVKSVMVPSLLDDLVINKLPSRLNEGRSVASSLYSGRGRLDAEKSWVANTFTYDSESNQLMVRITGLNYIKLDVVPKPDPHTFHSVSWKPDITFFTQDQMMFLTPDKTSNKLDIVLDLIAHKKSALKVLEVNLDDTNTSCMWFDASDLSIRAAYSKYDFVSSNAKALVNVQTQYEGKEEASFLTFSPEKEALDLSIEVAYDLAIINASESITVISIEELVKNLKSLLSADAFTLFIRHKDEAAAKSVESGSSDGFEYVNSTPSPETSETPGTSSESSGSQVNRPASSISSAAWDQDAAKKSSEYGYANGSGSSLEIATTSNSSLAYLWSSTETCPGTGLGRNLLVVRLAKITPQALPSTLQSLLEASGWTIRHQTYSSSKSTDEAVVLILDELWNSILTQADEKQWEVIKGLVSFGNPLLWVTEGAQDSVTNPDNAMINGLFRVARQENSSAKLITLDVQFSTSPGTFWAIEKVLASIRREDSAETEYMKRNGLLYIPRIMPDAAVNNFKNAEAEGLEPIVKDLHDIEVQVRLRAERLGTLQSLMWCETELEEGQLDTGNVEVEVVAAGVNFKDVAITMGIVPDDEHNIDLECGGVVKRLGPRVTKFEVGDRVCMLRGGSYANRVRVPVERCHLIPASMSFEEAATIPSMYLCFIYSIHHLANLKEGQSILIHSATGEVDIACIQLAQYKKAEIYVTIETEGKRQFLESTHGIPRSRMFSSRNTKFADEIMRETGGRDVDCIINSLVGELLNASWRIVADGDTMVEIGKRDIVDRNILSMKPFDRNCSFRALDLSYTQDMTDSVIEKLFDELFPLIETDHLKPIHSITTFEFEDIISALAYIRSGKHLGKIVIFSAEKEDVRVTIRPAIRKLRLQSDVSYLIVGGLKGACGTLAIHMAQHGARHIIVSSRSGISDAASIRIVNSCAFHGCKVIEAKRDVDNVESVRRMFKSASPRISGVIQEAMVLRVSLSDIW